MRDLRQALSDLQDRLDAEPGPGRHAKCFVDYLIDRGELDPEVARESPMLVGALLALLRHVRVDPTVTIQPTSDDDGTSRVWYVTGHLGTPWTTYERSELAAVVAALIAEAA